MRAELEVCKTQSTQQKSLRILSDGDTLFFFNYRSDRMREIVTVFGLPDKPMEVDVPKDLVCILANFRVHLFTNALCSTSQPCRVTTKSSHSLWPFLPKP
jgi:bisphosphoglycerate-independent phosphoglycerate mutase (AlkP superfamily)